MWPLLMESRTCVATSQGLVKNVCPDHRKVVLEVDSFLALLEAFDLQHHEAYDVVVLEFWMVA